MQNRGFDVVVNDELLSRSASQLKRPLPMKIEHTCCASSHELRPILRAIRGPIETPVSRSDRALFPVHNPASIA